MQLRAHGQVSTARLTVRDDEIVATLGQPQHGIAAGQALVVYAGDEVLGSATITAAYRADPSVEGFGPGREADAVSVAG